MTARGFIALHLLAAGLLWTLAAAALAAAPPGTDPTSPLAIWFAAQTRPDNYGGSCCNFADGYILRDDQWRVGASGEYEVLTKTGWLVFPNTGQGAPGNTVLGPVQNPTGSAVAWWIGKTPYCFTAGPQT